jgi:hypothetical protein
LNNEKYRTSLYVASAPRKFPTRSEVRSELLSLVKQFAVDNDADFLEEKQLISYNGIQISFLVNDAPKEQLYIASFQPTGENRNFWRKQKNIDAASSVLKFCDSFGSEFDLPKCDLNFKRISLSSEDCVDLSNWEVICSDSKKSSLDDFLRATNGSRYENIFSLISKEHYIYHIFTKTFFKGIEPFPQLRNFLSDFGKVEGPKPIDTVKEFSEKLSPQIKKRSVFVFLEDSNSLDRWYENHKIFFDSNKVPTQYIDEKTVREKLQKWVGVRANLILEMLTKMGEPPVVLQGPEEIFTNDAFLCLSDVVSTRQRLFGALFTYSKQGLGLKGDVQIYDDIEFETPTPYSLELSEENVDLLTRKVKSLIARRLRIDILLTRKWKQENIDRLIGSLLKNGIQTEKVYYISSKTSRFVDEFLEDPVNQRSLRYMYKIIGNRIAFLKTCTEVRIYPTIFSQYVELIYPEKAKITHGDLEKILWLTKKRIYRIQEFHVLKNVEPVYIFRNLRKMYLGKIEESLDIPLRLLI